MCRLIETEGEMKTRHASAEKSAKIVGESPEALTGAVKEKAFALGAHLVGVAPMERLEGAPRDLHPRRLLPEVQTVVSMAYRINRGVQQLHLRGISPMPFSRFAGLEPKVRLDEMALDLANFLEDRGYVSLPIPANQYYLQEKGLGELSHKHVAMAAGLGRLGRGGFLVTPQYGGAVQLISVLTTAPLLPDPMMDEDLCAGCPQLCVNICPVQAIRSDRDRVIVMDGKEHRYGWLSYLRCQWGCGGMVMGDRFYALSDLPMPALDEEDDPKSVRLEFLLAGEKRFPWDQANRSAFTYVACSKCYVACHPEKLKEKKTTRGKDCTGKAR
jgi:epoxyqueuosine reductase